MDSERRCGTCRWWRQKRQTRGRGTCVWCPEDAPEWVEYTYPDLGEGDGANCDAWEAKP